MPIRRLSVLVFRETRNRWMARCLEHDMFASGRSTDAAVDAVIRMIRAHVDFDYRHRRVPLSAFAPAPRLYRDAFERSSHSRFFDETSGLAHVLTVIDVAIIAQDPAIREFAAVSRIA